MRKHHLTLKLAAAVLALLALKLGAAVAASAQEGGARKVLPTTKQAAAQNPEGLSFTIRLKGGKSQFRQGEVIPVELLFSSSLPDTYILDAASYDRSGRLDADTFHLSPRAGLVDPFEDYLQFGLFGSMGGLRATPELGSKPYIIEAQLNEWFRFERPGKYTLYVTNERVSRISPDGRTFPREGLRLTSNTIEFEVLPADAAWSKRKLQEAAATLDAGGQGRRAACRTLRFLNTEAAALEMVRRFGGPDSECEFEYYAGLLGSPQRQVVIKEIEEAIGTADRPVTGSFINVLSLIKFAEGGHDPMPPYPAGDPERQRAWQAEMQKRRDAHREITEGYLGQLSAAVSGKQKQALAVSLNTLLEYRDTFPGGAGSDGQIATALVAVFADLPPEKQQTILLYRWKRIAGPAMLPVLRRIYERPGVENRDLRDLALRRINELAPDEGRRLILSEIQSGRPRVKASTLGLLPEATLPELDDTLASQLEKINSDYDYDAVTTYSSLLARYATASPLSRVRAAYEEKVGKLACEIQTNLLYYFLRVDPAYGSEALERSLASRKETGCYSGQFSALSGERWSPEVSQAALAHLTDPDPEVLAQAAAVLGRHGPASAEQALWEAFERWHARYGGAGDRLRQEMKKAGLRADPSAIELSLVQAIGSGSAWVTGPDKFRRLAELCVTEQCRQDVAAREKQSGQRLITLFLDTTGEGVEHISVAQYHVPSFAALKEKLAQYPEGTVFEWSAPNASGVLGERLFEDLRAYLGGRGMRLEKFSPGK